MWDDIIDSVASAADLPSGSNMGDTEEICVFVPQQKTRYPKLASLWRGPLQIKKNISDVLYEIDCSTNGHTQTEYCIYSRHCDKYFVRNRQEMTRHSYI